MLNCNHQPSKVNKVDIFGKAIFTEKNQTRNRGSAFDFKIKESSI